MSEVMQKAQELADAIVRSGVYQDMKRLEKETEENPEAAAALETMIEKRRRVEELLTEKGMDPEELKRANAEMAEAERAMNRNGKVMELKNARKEFSAMMNNVNRILRLVITGEIREDDLGSGCGGSCEGCNGCG